MADLRLNFLEDYAGGLLNVSRQELSSNGEVLSQDGFPTDATIFVEDGVGVKSGLKLGVGLAECVDPTTSLGVVNVRFADRTYTKTRDLKIFTMATASAQAALSESVAESIGVIEGVLDSTNARLDTSERNQSNLQNELTNSVNNTNVSISNIQISIETLMDRVSELESSDPNPNVNFSIGYEAFKSLKGGTRNIAIGYGAAPNLKDGSLNCFYGVNSGYNLESGSNSIYLGAHTRGDTSNEIVLGNYDHIVVRSNSDTYTPIQARNSDYDNLTFEIYDPTSIIEDLKSLSITKIYKANSLFDISVDYDSLKNNLDSQSLNTICYFGNNDYIYLSKARLVPILVKAVQELITRIETLEQGQRDLLVEVEALS